jgi:hypothetical protein
MSLAVHAMGANVDAHRSILFQIKQSPQIFLHPNGINGPSDSRRDPWVRNLESNGSTLKIVKAFFAERF